MGSEYSISAMPSQSTRQNSLKGKILQFLLISNRRRLATSTDLVWNLLSPYDFHQVPQYFQALEAASVRINKISRTS